MGTKLKTLLAHSGTSQQDLASLTGLSAASISMYCSGETAPSDKTLRIIAKHLGIDPDDINIRRQRPPGSRLVKLVVDWPGFKALLVKRKKTLTGLAEEIGVTRQALQAYHTGRGNPAVSTLGRIARRLKVNPLDLLTNEAVEALSNKQRTNFQKRRPRARRR